MDTGTTPVARRTRSALRNDVVQRDPANTSKSSQQPAAAPVTPDNPEPMLVQPAAAMETVPQPSEREIAAANAARARLAGQDYVPAEPSRKILPTGPEPVSSDVEYTATADLQPLDNPNQQCQAMLPALDSTDWVQVVSALTLARRLLTHHPAILQPKLSVFVPLLLKSVKNLRSSVCKTALMCTAEAFVSLRGAMLPFTDRGGVTQPATSLLHQLLLKASIDKKFLAEEAQQALSAFAQHLPPREVLPLLVAYVAHKNPKVRGQTARALTMSAVAAGSPEVLAGFGMDRLLRAAGTLISDNTPEARNAARDLITLIQAAFQASSHEAGREDSSLQQSAPNNTPAKLQTGDTSPSKIVPTPWESFCRAVLKGTTAALVLRASSQ